MGSSCRKNGKVIYLCRGSKCKKQTAPESLSERFRVKEVKCQKICKGLVVGIKVDGSLEWFRKIDSKKDLKALRKIAKGNGISSSLVDKRTKKRAGKLR